MERTATNHQAHLHRAVGALAKLAALYEMPASLHGPTRNAILQTGRRTLRMARD